MSITRACASEYFVTEHQIDDMIRKQFLALHPKYQYVVTKKSLDDARDKTAVLAGRIKQLKGLIEGDWLCPVCEDIQFGRNETCRGCSMPKPEGLGINPNSAAAQAAAAAAQTWWTAEQSAQPDQGTP